MKRLSIVRHAKAVVAKGEMQDFDRPLSAAGRMEARQAAERFAAREQPPILLLSSPALRARETASAFAIGLNGDNEGICFDPRLYLASPDTLLDIIQLTPEDVGQLAVFGHNPGLVAFLHSLSGDASPRDFPTAAVCTIRLEAPVWSALGAAPCSIVAFETPIEQ